MSFPLLGSPKPQFLDSSGTPYASGTLAILEPVDDTAKTYYPTADDADAATNGATATITLDARGCTPNGLFGVDDQKYKLVLKDAAAATIWTVDDIRVPSRNPTLYGKTAQTTVDAYAVSLTESTTFITTTTPSTLTLADGVENQMKYLVMKTDGGIATLAPTSFANGTTIIFDDVGDSAHLLFANASWHWVGGTATVTGYSPGTAVTFTSADATPTVGIGETFITAGTTAITDFDNGVVGQTIRILAASTITITHNGSIILLDNGANFNMVSGYTLTLHMFNDQVWEEVARSGVSTGSWTAVVTGFSADPASLTMSYVKDSSIVTIYVGMTTGTSNATTFTVTNLPAFLTPSSTIIVPITGLHDNTAASAENGSVQIAGTTLTFGLGADNATGGGWTGSGTKGFQSGSVSFSYSLGF